MAQNVFSLIEPIIAFIREGSNDLISIRRFGKLRLTQNSWNLHPIGLIIWTSIGKDESIVVPGNDLVGGQTA